MLRVLPTPRYIEPMLDFQGIKQTLEKASCDVIAISPVLSDEAIDPPMRRLIEEALGHGTSVIEIIKRYPGLIDTLIIDESDGKHKEELLEMGQVLVLETTSAEQN